ncbi:MAG TPA: hypothetical protein VKT78_12340 [Fimbriimonadaceae bacterium]|nr:hypothetical protein [Fimbriimonadaceae bacterium]
MPFVPKQILNLSSTTSPALASAAYHSDPKLGGGFGYGRPAHQQFFVQVVRANASPMTGVKFQVQVARDPSSPIWIPIRARKASDVTATFALELEVDASAGSTNEDVLLSDDADGIPLVRVVAKSVGADAGVGDSCSAWAWV